MSGGKSLKPEQNERVRAAVRSLMTANGWDQAEIGERIGVTQQSVSSYLAGRTGVGFATAERIAALARVDVTTLVNGTSSGDELRIERPDRYANRAATLQFLAPELHPVTVERANTIALASRSDLPRSTWVSRIKALDDEVRAELADPAVAEDKLKAEQGELDRMADEERATQAKSLEAAKNARSRRQPSS